MKMMTEGNPAKLILFFSIPLLLGNVFQQFYNLTDTLIVGKTLGVEALAAVGATSSVVFLILGFSWGLTAGLAIPVAQYYGAQNEVKLKRSIAINIVLVAVGALILMSLGGFFSRNILELMRTPADLLDNATKFLQVLMFGIGATMLFNMLSSVIRSLGDSRTPLIFLVISCILNIFMDFSFILNFGMGVEGAAYATILAQILASICCIIYVYKKFPVFRLTKHDFKFSKADIIEHVRIAVPMGFQMSIIAIGAIMVQVALNGLGPDAVAAFTVAGRIDQLAIQPMVSFGTAVSTYAAQNYGAGKISRVWQGVRTTNLMSGTISIVFGVLVISFGQSLVGLFLENPSQHILDLVQQYFYVNSSCYIILSIMFGYRYSLQGMGNSLAPTISGIMELVMRGVGAIIGTMLFGFVGTSASNPLAWLGALIPVAIVYYQTKRDLSLQL